MARYESGRGPRTGRKASLVKVWSSINSRLVGESGNMIVFVLESVCRP